jgi:Zn-dependent protease
MSDAAVQQLLHNLSIWLIPGLLAITLHEVSHGWVAKQLGDPTAYMLGRLTVNPLKHIDPLGTVVVPIAMLVLSQGQMAFGWAKPVPVAFRNLRNPKRDMVWVAAAGPISNFIMAAAWTMLLAALRISGADGTVAEWLAGNCVFGIQINVILAVFNLLPIPPLDGGRVLAGLLPRGGSNALERIEPFGLIIVVVLMVSGALWTIMSPLRYFFLKFYFNLAGYA